MRKTHPRFIAEIGSNHNRDLDRVRALIKEASELGFWAVKFQLFKAEKLYHPSMEKEIAVAKERELPFGYIPFINELCRQHKIKFICTPFDTDSAKSLNEYIDYYKISSFDIDRNDLITSCVNTNKNLLFVSAGLSYIQDIPETLNNFYIANKQRICLMHCVSQYPTKPEKSAVYRIDLFNRLFSDFIHSVGYSDHTADIETIIDAIYFGAQFIELHFDLEDKKGWEYKYGHCWIPSKIRKLFFSIGKQNDIRMDNMIEKYGKTFTSPFVTEMQQKADPSDGLRPRKEIRKCLKE